MFDAFLSYSRHDEPFAIRLRSALDAAGKTLWLDKRDIMPAEDWRAAAFAGIDSASNFLFVISPDSVKSRPDGSPAPCGEEIAHAAASGKRLIPLHYRSTPHADIAKEIRDLNDINFRDTDADDAAFNLAFATLIAAMDTDLAWVRQHTLLQGRALDWETKNKDSSALLRGDELKTYEAWQAQPQSPGQQIKPTPLQLEYLLASRRAETHAQKLKTRIAAAVAVVSLCLAGIALAMFVRARHQTRIAHTAEGKAETERKEAVRQTGIAQAQTAIALTQTGIANKETTIAQAKEVEAQQQRDEAEHQARIATAGSLAATAISLQDTQLDLASLLALEASRTADTFDSRNALPTLALSHPRLLTYLRQGSSDQAPVDSIAFSPDGSRFATQNSVGDLRIWNAYTLKPVWTHRSRPGIGLPLVAYSSDGKILALIDGTTFQLWRVTVDKPVLIASDPAGLPVAPVSAAFSPDGALLAVAGDNGTQLWTLPDLRPLRTLPALPSPSRVTTWSIAFSPKDPALLASARSDANILLENVRTGASRLEPMPVTGADGMMPIAFSPDGKFLAAGTGTRDVGLWEVHGETLKFRSLLSIGDRGLIMSVAFSPNGRFLAATCTVGAMREWDVATLHLEFEAPASLTPNNESVAFNHDGSQLLEGIDNGVVLVWDQHDPSRREFFAPPAKQRAPIRTVVLSPDSRFLAAKDFYGGVFLWDAATGRLLQQLSPRGDRPDPDQVGNLQFSPDGANLFFVRQGKPAVLDLKTMSSNPLPVPATVFVQSAQGSFAFALDKGVLLVDTRGKGVQKLLPTPPAAASTVAFSPESNFLAVAGFSPNTTRLWRLGSGAPIAIPLQGPDVGADKLVFNRSGNLLASVYYQGLQLWNTATGKRVGAQLQQNVQTIEDASFSPDGKRIALAFYAGAVKLVDVESLRPLGTPLQPDLGEESDGPSGVTFSSDGKLLAYGGDHGNVILWKSSPAAWAGRACQVANRNLSPTEWKRYMGDIPYHHTCPTLPAN